MLYWFQLCRLWWNWFVWSEIISRRTLVFREHKGWERINTWRAWTTNLPHAFYNVLDRSLCVCPEEFTTPWLLSTKIYRSANAQNRLLGAFFLSVCVRTFATLCTASFFRCDHINYLATNLTICRHCHSFLLISTVFVIHN